ncbi:M28 family peptidase [bacterium]|nr:M28 family peptidase [bacterium]
MQFIRFRRVSLSTLLAATVLYSVGCMVSPSRIDKARLLSHVETLSSDGFAGRRTATEGGAMAVSYVENAMQEMGLTSCSEALRVPFEFSSRRSEELVSGINLVGYIAGTGTSPKTIVVTAHFDHLGERGGEVFNGADDNASGTGAMLELARYFIANPPLHSMIFAGLDAEEMGLQGARALVASPCVSGRDVALNINMDMISRSPKGELYAVGTFPYPFLKPALEALPERDGVTLLFGHETPGTGSDDWTNSSDHGPFNQAGIPFIYFGVEDHPGYHNPTDDFAEITPEFYYETTELILDALLAYDATLDTLRSE